MNIEIATRYNPNEYIAQRQNLLEIAGNLPLLDRAGPIRVIERTRDGLPLSINDIRGWIKGVTEETIPSYQIASWLAHVVQRELSREDTIELTKAMAASGDILDLSWYGHPILDKHSSGGVGDKTTLVVAPLVATCEAVGKMSGRGLGFSGGTLDKLQSIPGFRVDLTADEFKKQLNLYGIVVTGQTGELAPADGKLYKLRDVTGNVPSIPLIASSIMSKKIAAGPSVLVLDVKVGSGAFMKTEEKATALAKLMVDIGNSLGIATIAQIADMNQPLGVKVGNALEVAEAIETLKGEGPADFKEHCIETAALMLLLAGHVNTYEQALAKITQNLSNGEALKKFRQMVYAQGGNEHVIDNLSILPRARIQKEIPASRGGFITGMKTDDIGYAVVALGGGRLKADDEIDPAVGFEIQRKIGDQVSKNEPIAILHANKEEDVKPAITAIQNALTIDDEFIPPPKLIHRIVT